MFLLTSTTGTVRISQNYKQSRSHGVLEAYNSLDKAQNRKLNRQDNRSWISYAVQKSQLFLFPTFAFFFLQISMNVSIFFRFAVCPKLIPSGMRDLWLPCFFSNLTLSDVKWKDFSSNNLMVFCGFLWVLPMVSLQIIERQHRSKRARGL